MFIVLIAGLFGIGLPFAAIRKLLDRSQTAQARREQKVARYVLGLYVVLGVVVAGFNLAKL